MAPSFTVDDDDYDRHRDSARATRLDAEVSHYCGHNSTTRSHQAKLDSSSDDYVKKLKDEKVSSSSSAFQPDEKKVDEKLPLDKPEHSEKTA